MNTNTTKPNQEYINALKMALTLYGYTLADTNTIVLTGRNGSMSLPAQAIVDFTWGDGDWQPVMNPCVQSSDGSWHITDGISLLERVP